MVDIDVKMTDAQRAWINESAREFLVEGSAGSGKTVFACYKVIFYALQYHHASIYVYRKTLPSLKRTAWKEIRNILYNIALEKDELTDKVTKTLYDVCHENKSEGTILFPNGSIIYFGALDELSKVRSINADLIYIEQAEELLDTAFYTELMLRLGRGDVSKRGDGYSQMMLVVQPESEEHWIFQRYHQYYDATKEYENEKREVQLHNRQSDDLWDYRDYDTILREIQARRVKAHFHYSQNDFLPQYQKDYYKQLKNENPDLWLRYSAGKWGKLTDVVYTNYDMEFPANPHYDFISFGADFGFINPSAFLLLGWYDNEVYVIDEVYEDRLTTTELIEKCNNMLFENKLLPEHLTTGYGDAAEPDRIKQFQQAGYPMVGGVKDVNAKITTTKQTRIHIHPRCVNTIKEIKGYVYRKNRDGVVLDEPVKDNDHSMDALAYGVYGVRGYLSPNRPKRFDNHEDTIMVF